MQHVSILSTGQPRITINKENMPEKNDFADYKKESLTLPRDEAWGNWKSWGDDAGEKVQGYVVDAFFRPEELRADGTIAFNSQRAVTLKQADGVLINVGIKDLSYVFPGDKVLHIGDPLTIELLEIKEPREKGHNGAKIYGYFGKSLDENKEALTVKQSVDADRADGGSEAPEDDIMPDDDEITVEDVNEEIK